MFGDLKKLFGKTVAGAAKRATTKNVSGFNRDQFNSFMQQAGSVGSSQRFIDPDSIKPEFQSKRIGITQANPFGRANGKVVSQDQMANMMKAFRQRQQEVFGRRAAPGVAQQTRFM